MNKNQTLDRHMSPLAAWAFSIGTSVGWGSLVVTANTYLVQSGIWGSVFGLVAATLIMLAMGFNYAYLMRSYPESGGSYTYTREVFGHDLSFLAAWFLCMTYFAVLWANATSLPLFSRIFLGNMFQFGKLYSIFGYDVYLGEVLLSIAALVLFSLLCITHKRVVDIAMVGMALVFFLGIAGCLLGAFLNGGHIPEPGFVPGVPELHQIVRIAVISPWAFIGFECISHATEEFRFDNRRIRGVLVISVISTLVMYLCVILLSVTAFPPAYDSWLAYIRDLDSLSGLEALPAFYAASHYLGQTGVYILMLALLALVFTSLIGNTMAISRLMYAMARDRILPEKFAKLNGKKIPANAVLLVMAISCLIPFVGRTAIGWIVDVTTIGATLIYGITSAAAARLARQRGDRLEKWTGRAGLGVMIAFGAYILIPDLLARGTMAPETYFLFVAWSVLGFVFFRIIVYRDREKRFGSSVSVWLALLSLVLVIALIWMRQSMISSNDRFMEGVETHYEDMEHPTQAQKDDLTFIRSLVDAQQATDSRTMIMAIGMFGFALVIMLTNHSYTNTRYHETEKLANVDPMTGVKNKHAYLMMEHELDMSMKEEGASPFAVVVCDVNGLKKINDTLGHKAGDEYIRTACEMICEVFRHSPVYRVGGDEFVAVLSGRDYTVRRDLMVQLHNLSAEHIQQGGAVVSAGLSDYDPQKDASTHDIFERADALMYEEKKLLKGLGAVMRDEHEEEAQILPRDDEKSVIRLRRHVLIVEDDTVSQEILGACLEKEYDVVYAATGELALKQVEIHGQELALVMLDLILPDRNGLEIIRIMKAHEVYKQIPIIVLSSEQSLEVECLRAGAMDFIPKPYPDMEIILERVNKCIELSENRDIIQSTERDQVTQLFNTDYFIRYVKLFDQHYEDMEMDAVVLDVVHFHMINERFGKQYGDSVLRALGGRIRQIARELGGVGSRQRDDVFLIYCPHQEDYTKILERISRDLLKGDDSTHVRLHMGVYEKVDKTLEIEQRFDRARMACEAPEQRNMHGIGFYDRQMHEQALFRERILDDFESSLEHGRFQVYLQPKFNIRSDMPVLASAEALVRWDHPELGVLQPTSFISLLEENGLIFKLDRYVWEMVARQIRDWKDRLGFAVPVSVNVSRIDLLVPGLKDIFLDILDRSGLTPMDIALEITELAYVGNHEHMIRAAKELHGIGMGLRIEMDDFGTGYSSLSMLTHLPIDALKLDMSFVKEAFGEKMNVRMIEMVLDIADYLHVPVVAEGVETEQQYLVLKAMGCDLVQGFYFSKPVPAGEFESFLVERGRHGADLLKREKKISMTISSALSDDFASIYYVDMLTDDYLLFKKNKDGTVLATGGEGGFLENAENLILSRVMPEDAGAVREALKKENLALQLYKPEPEKIPCAMQEGEQAVSYTLQVLRPRNSDDQHIALVIRRA